MSNKYQDALVNVNLQQSNDFLMIIEGDERMNIKDVTYRIRNFPIPEMSIPKIMVPTQINKIPYPGQGSMSYGDLVAEILVDDNLNNYQEIMKWIYRLKNPEYLFSIENNGDNFLSKPSNNNYHNLKLTDQYPMDYRDISVLIADTNGQFVKRVLFSDSFPYQMGSLQMNAQAADYQTVSINFAFSLMTIWDSEGNQLV